MNILFVHEVDWLKKVVLEFHNLSEALSLLNHRVYAIDYESMWERNGCSILESLKMRGLVLPFFERLDGSQLVLIAGAGCGFAFSADF